MLTRQLQRAAFSAAHIACLTLLAAAPTQFAHAEEANKASATYRFSIPAGPLVNALTAFAEATNANVAYTPQLVRGLSSDGVSGEQTATSALDQLLKGTGLAYRYVRGNAFTIEKIRESNGTRTLGPVRVEGADRVTRQSGVNGSRDATATEGSGSFTTDAMTIGSKAPRSLKDTTQSVSVITSEQLEQQNISDFTHALKQAPGVSFIQGNTSLDTRFYSRGYEVTSIQIDGGAPLTTRFSGSFGRGFFPQIDLSQYDHVEVLRGAAGLFNGYGDPSGTVNLVRKKPLDRKQVTLEAEAGSWEHYRTVLDATAPLALDGRLRGRMVATWQQNKHFYALAEDEKTLLYGMLDYELTPTTTIAVGLSHNSQDSRPWYAGLPRYQTGEDLRLPRRTSLVFPWNRWNFDTTEIFGSLEQQLGQDWSAKLNLTHNKQESERKVGYSVATVNPIDNRGPRLFAEYNDFASDQLSAEATLAGAFTLFGQRQELVVGLNRSDQDGGGLASYLDPLKSSAAAPYQPYPGGPRYCTDVNVCPIGVASPPINIFALDPYNPIYGEPARPLRSTLLNEQGHVQTLAYLNLRLTAFERLHLETGLRWSRYESKLAAENLCTSIPTSGTPNGRNCVGRQIGDTYSSLRETYVGEEFSWPPSVALSYDVTDALLGYVGYADIYLDQSSYLDGDLQPLAPVTGENIELGVKWAARDGRLNASLSVYRIEKQGFQQQEPGLDARWKRNPDGSYFVDSRGNAYLITNDGTELLNGQPDPSHYCCYIQRQNQTEVSEGVDTELAGELLPGWQVSASYTYSRTEQQGAYYAANEGRPFRSIQPEHLYKLWTSYDFGAAGATGWLSRFAVSAGVNGQSSGFQAGQVCPDGQVGPPDPRTGVAACRIALVRYEFTVKPYTVMSSRIDYRLNDVWSAALNIENIFDESYYESVGNVTSGNWYGRPRAYTLSLRSRF